MPEEAPGEAVVPTPSAEARHRLLEWFFRHRRELPWREEHDPYRIWISEVMLQQTRAETVAPYYQRWLEHFPDLASLAAASEQSVLKTWEGLGYYSRARNLRAAARWVLERRGGEFPRSLAEARQLPGVGEYIAAAVLSIAYGLPHGVVDGNTIRVVSRLTADAGPATDSPFRGRVRAFIERSFGSFHPGWMNQAWMELGALVCTPAGTRLSKPRCSACPLAQTCAAHRLGNEEMFPTRTANRIVPVREESALLLIPAQFAAAPAQGVLLPPGAPTLFVRRPSRGLLGGLWELPTWPLRGAPLREELAARGIELLRPLDLEVAHTYSHFRQRLQAVLAVFRSEQALEPWVEQRWVAPGDLERYPRPRAQIRLLRALGLDSAAWK